MNFLYITLFFNIVAGIVQTFIKSWYQLLYPWVIEVCRLRFEPRHDFFLHLIIAVVELPSENSRHHCVTFCRFTTLPQTATICSWISARRSPFALRNLMTERTSHLAGFWIGAPFQTRLTQTKPVLPLLNEHGSKVKDLGRRQCCHNKHKKFPIGLHVMYLYFPDTPCSLSR